MSQHPNAVIHHGRDPAQLRAELEAAGWTLTEAAVLAGVSTRLLVGYMRPGAPADAKPMPYPLQYTLEAIARTPRAPRIRSTRGRKPAERPPPAPAPVKQPLSWKDRLIGSKGGEGAGS